MIQIVDWIIKNWKLISIIGIVIIILSLTKPITITLRSAKDGLKEATTPLGIFVFLVLVVLVIVLITKMGNLFE